MICKYALTLSFIATTTFALPHPEQIALQDQESASPEEFLIELAPGHTRWVTEEDKWALRRVLSS
jgi:bacterial leucyl aminopeptidase